MVKMRTVGDIIEQARKKQRLEIAYVASQTKIKPTYLLAIEKGEWSKLPDPPFTKGLIRNYAQFLHLNPEEILAVFRREFDEYKEVGSQRPPFIMQSFVRFTPTTFLRISIGMIAVLFVAYFIREYRILTGPPNLTLERPQENVQVQGTGVAVAGETSPEAVVTVNGQTISVGTDGTFATTIEMMQGGKITVTASSKSGKSTTIERTVIIK